MADDDSPLPEFNDLVREAHSAQDAFDHWDRGVTYDPTWRSQRRCTLAEIELEWSKANLALIEFVLAHGEQLRGIEQASIASIEG